MPVSGFAQTFPRGAVLDPVLYDSLPQKAVQVSKAYETLPQTVSLKSFAPFAGDQGDYGTCVAWSSAYAARTILESVTLNRQDRLLSTANVFSPNFVYKSLFIFNGQPDDPEGEGGAAVAWALTFMRDKGPVKMLELEKQTDFKRIPLSLFTNSRAYPIAEYATLFRSDTQNPAIKIQMVKKSLTESKPVIIGMNCPDSFFSASDVWYPSESPLWDYGGHSVCVVGYDDTRGAFEVQNSWGTGWGNAGFIWLPYADFVEEAYGITENPGLYENAIEYAGFAEIQVRGSEAGMPVSLQDGYYQTRESYTSGTMFRYLMGNSKPAYVYAFAADDSNAPPTQIFPMAGSNVSPLLDYTENIVAFPGEFSWIQLDKRPGTDYLVVLYSKRALNIATIRDRFARERGTFPERVARAVGSNYIPFRQANYEKDKLAFTAQSVNANAVFGLLLAIKHQ
jgi:hypothetical protein